MTNEELVFEIQQGHTEKLEELWSQNEKFIRMLAKEFHAGDLEEDLCQESYFGLLEAAKRYDYSQGAKFITYAAYYIKQSMRRFMHNARPGIRLPEHMIEKIRKYDRFVAAFFRTYGREPTDLEAKLLLKMPDVKRVKAAAMNPTSLDKEICEGDTSLYDLAGADDTGYDDVLDNVFLEQVRKDLWGILGEMPEQYQTIMQEYYWNGKKYREIASDMGVSIERVRQVIAKVLRTLRNRKELKPYYQEVYNHALSGSSLRAFERSWTSSTEKTALWLIERSEIESALEANKSHFTGSQSVGG